jgi:hypothetical protein
VCARSATQYSIQRQSEIVSKRLLNVNRNEKIQQAADCAQRGPPIFSDSKQQGKSEVIANLSQFEPA